MQIRERVVFTLERRPLGRRLAGLDKLNRLRRVCQRFGVVRLVFRGSRKITSVSEVDLRAQVIRLVRKDASARLVSFAELLLVNQARQIAFALVALVSVDPLIEIIGVLV